MLIANMASGQIAIQFRCQRTQYLCGDGLCHRSPLYRRCLSRHSYGDADAIIAGGTEANITPLTIAGFNAMKALSTRNDEPEKASRPFEKNRDGFVVAEGAGILILEELEFALETRSKDLRRIDRLRIYRRCLSYYCSISGWRWGGPMYADGHQGCGIEAGGD